VVEVVVVSLAVSTQAISAYLVAGEEEVELQYKRPEVHWYNPTFLGVGSPYLAAAEEEEAVKMRQQDCRSFLEVVEEETFQVVVAEGTFPFQVVVVLEKTSRRFYEDNTKIVPISSTLSPVLKYNKNEDERSSCCPVGSPSLASQEWSRALCFAVSLLAFLGQSLTLSRLKWSY
jgi:hypothetical protein